jgi:protein phosphatase
LIADFAKGTDVGLAVLADGMGGHAAGDVASKIVVSEVFSELLFQRGDARQFEARVTEALRNAAHSANACLRDHVLAQPETRGMGATLVATVVIQRNLYWLSVGDSPLYLFRDGLLIQLNEDHSMAPQIDFMVENGLMGSEEGQSHPDRNVLTSVLFGEAIPRIDCPGEPVELEDGDMLVIASDGLQHLSTPAIKSILTAHREAESAVIADRLLDGIHAIDDPDLDNVSFSIIKIKEAPVLRTAEAAPGGLRCVS